MTGGGQQVPGFIGVGKAYITSRKFIAAEGGHERIVWMPRELKETLREDLSQIGERLGIENFIELIADETVGDGRRGRAGVHGEGGPSRAGDVGDHRGIAGSRGSRATPGVRWRQAVFACPACAVRDRLPADANSHQDVPSARSDTARVARSPLRATAPCNRACDGIGEIISVLERLRARAIAHERLQPGMSAGAADGRAAGLHRAASAARRRQHAADVQRGTGRAGPRPAPVRWRRSADLRAPAKPPEPPKERQAWDAREACVRSAKCRAGRGPAPTSPRPRSSCPSPSACAPETCNAARPQGHAGRQRNAHLGGDHRRR